MDLDAFKMVWADYDGKLDEGLRLNRRLLVDGVIGRARSALRPLIAGLVVECVADLLAVAALGSFCYANRSAPQFLIPGIAIDMAAIAVVISLIRQAVEAARIDYGMSVAAIQESLATLRIWRLRTLRWILLASPLAWTPFLIVALRFFGVDAYATLGAGYLWANVAFGVAFLGIGYWLAQTLARRMSGGGPLASIARALEGSELRRATEAAASLREFAGDA